jgi:hypothetical protein
MPVEPRRRDRGSAYICYFKSGMNGGAEVLVPGRRGPAFGNNSYAPLRRSFPLKQAGTLAT